jgi:predicted TIM-barrel fold metal-dependent hydrolase
MVFHEHVLFGSDWPHGEGLADPQSFMIELDGFGEHAVTRVMRENALELLGL